KMWELMARKQGATARMPRQTESAAWAANLIGWAHFLGKEVSQLDEAWTLLKLCRDVEAKKTVAALKEQLAERFKLTDDVLAALRQEGAPEPVLDKLQVMKNEEPATKTKFLAGLLVVLGQDDLGHWQERVLLHAKLDENEDALAWLDELHAV